MRKDTFCSLPPEIAEDYLLKPGDILLARSGATVGKAFLFTSEVGKACHAGYLIRARPDPNLVKPEFLYAFTQSAIFKIWKDSIFIIATIQNIAADKYADLHVPIPPLSEQTKILDYIDSELKPVNATIGRTECEVELVREYRTRLFADVVTGKLDVREAAASLPEEALEPDIEALDENDSLDEEAENGLETDSVRSADGE
jgi:type I restriction enzyme S subunit